MRITRVEAQEHRLRLVEPYDIAYGRFTYATNIFVRIETDGRLIGHGCATPEPEVTGERGGSVLAAYRDVAPAVLRGRDPLRRAPLLDELRRAGLGPAARAGLDMALFDLLGKHAGLPLWVLLGGARDAIETSVTIPIVPLDEAVTRARELVGRGFRCLKLKGGRSVEDDIERLLAVRRATGEGVDLRFDANQGYDAAAARRLLEGAAGARLELLEQPTPASETAVLAEVTRRSEVPVMADESLLRLRDVFRLGGDEAADMLNVKLMKVGGLAEALDLHGAARAARLDLMVGCMDEAALGIAAGLQIALGLPGVSYADLDGHLDLVDDPSAGAVDLRDGWLHGGDTPGLGWSPR